MCRQEAYKHLFILYFIRVTSQEEITQRKYVLYSRYCKYIEKAHFLIGCDSLSVFGVDVPSMVATSLFLTFSAHITIKLYHNVEYCDL